MKELEDKIDKMAETLETIKAALGLKGVENKDGGFVSLEYICKTFKLSKESVRRYRSKGKLPSYKLGGKVFFKMDEVTRAIKNNFLN